VFSQRPIYAFNAGDGCPRETTKGNLCTTLLQSTVLLQQTEFISEFDKRTSNF